MQDPMVSTGTAMHTIVNPPVVTIPHGMMHMPGFHTTMPECAPIQQIPSSVQSMSPHHSSPPPTYSPPHQPGSPHRGSTYATSYPGSPPQGGHMAHQPVMMEELGSPPHMGHHHTVAGTMIESYVDRSPSRSPIQQHKYIHSPQGLYATSNPQAIRI